MSPEFGPGRGFEPTFESKSEEATLVKVDSESIKPKPESQDERITPEVEKEPERDSDRVEENARPDIEKLELASSEDVLVQVEKFEVDKSFLLGDFADHELVNGRIVLSPEVKKQINDQVERIKTQNRFRLPSLAHGNPTAAEYDSQASNWSTDTSIITGSDGKKVFVVNRYPFSRVHRWIDTFNRKLAGLKFSKVPAGQWKETFESRSNIPVIENDDPKVVLMPFLENVNLGDLISRNHEMTDFGGCQWADNLDLEAKLQMLDKALDQLSEIHQRGEAWGEAIIGNMIATKEQKVVICDPETLYDDDVSEAERRAGDLRDFVFSATAGMLKSGDVTDPASVVNRLLNRYGDADVIDALQKKAVKKLTLVQRAMVNVLELGRLSFASRNDYDVTQTAVLKYVKSE